MIEKVEFGDPLGGLTALDSNANDDACNSNCAATSGCKNDRGVLVADRTVQAFE